VVRRADRKLRLRNASNVALVEPRAPAPVDEREHESDHDDRRGKERERR
jgi:hypothetical protein